MATATRPSRVTAPGAPTWAIRAKAGGKLIAVLPAGRFATPSEAIDYYLRGAIVLVRDVIALPVTR